MADKKYAYEQVEPDIPTPSESGFRVPAEVHTDDMLHAVAFDAAAFFDAQSDEELVSGIPTLMKVDFGGDYPADAVAENVQDRDGYEDVNDLFAYLSRHPKQPTGDPVGFEVHVDGGSLMSYLKDQRPEAFERIREAEPDLVAETMDAPAFSAN